MLQLSKDNSELREKRITLETLLVLETEEMAELDQTYADLHERLVRLAMQREELVRQQTSRGFLPPPYLSCGQRESIASIKELSAVSHLEKSVLSGELKKFTSTLLESDAQPQGQPNGAYWRF